MESQIIILQVARNKLTNCIDGLPTTDEVHPPSACKKEEEQTKSSIPVSQTKSDVCIHHASRVYSFERTYRL